MELSENDKALRSTKTPCKIVCVQIHFHNEKTASVGITPNIYEKMVSKLQQSIKMANILQI